MADPLFADEGRGLSIIKRPTDADLDSDWEYAPIRELCQRANASAELRRLLLEQMPKEHPPILLSEPGTNISLGRLARDIGSGFFSSDTIHLFTDREDPTGKKERLRVCVTGLKDAGVLCRDELSLIHCSSCERYSIGRGDVSARKSFFCTKCGKAMHERGSTNTRVTPVYTFIPEVRDLLLQRQKPGRLLEGLVYHALKGRAALTERYDIVPSAYLLTARGEGLSPESNELDIVLIDRQKTRRPIVVLCSAGSTQDYERRQGERSRGADFHTVFVTVRGFPEQVNTAAFTDKIFQRINDDDHFPENIADYLEALTP